MMEHLAHLWEILAFWKDDGRTVEVHPERPRPHRDWLIMLSVFVVCNALIAVLSYLFFLKVVHGEIFLVSQKNESGIKTFSSQELAETLERFRDKKERFHELGGPPLPAHVSSAPAATSPAMTATTTPGTVEGGAATSSATSTRS